MVSACKCNHVITYGSCGKHSLPQHPSKYRGNTIWNDHYCSCIYTNKKNHDMFEMSEVACKCYKSRIQTIIIEFFVFCKRIYFLLLTSYSKGTSCCCIVWMCLQWYHCCQDLLGEQVRSQFIQSHLDEDTQAFLRRSVEKSGWLFMQLYHSLFSTIFSPVVSRTSING